MTRRGVAIAGVPWLAISLLTGVRPAAAEPGEGHAPPAAEPTAGDEPPFRCKPHPGGKVVVTFKADADVKDLVTWVMGFTCKNVLVDPRVGATNRRISIVAPSAMSTDDAYQVFLAALATISLTVVTRGNTLRIVEASGAHKEAVPLLHAGTPGDTDQYVRYVYKPSFVAAEQLHTAYTAMKSDAGDVFTLGPVVVMTDYASHVREMLAFARLVDVPGGSDGIYTLPVHHADAGKLAEKLNAILGPAPAGPAAIRPAAPDPGKLDPGRSATAPAAVPSKIVVDERTNTLIIAASEAGYQRVQALVERLDIALEMEGGSAIHVYPLGSAIAEELARTLTQAISDGRGPRPPTGAGAGGPPTAPPRSGVGTAGPPAAPPDASLDGLGAAIEGQVRVIADPPTNALIVIANARDFLAIKDVIRQLDLPRRQVYIETVILDVDVTAHDQLGTVAHAGSTLGQNGSQDRELISTSKIPLLGDIPLLGYLFKTTTRTKQRTNLVVVMTPYIIRQQADLYAIRERKLREYDEFARSMSELSHTAYEPDVDYRKKRGLVEEINRAVIDAEHDAAARTRVDAAPPGVAAGSVDLPLPPALPPAPRASP